ncbi:Uncharacterised protein [Burkholderia pseudomallei]|nr:Uncharacterised protein [Burkholderia pseudomallei]
MHERDETEIAQFLLAAVGDRDLGRALERDFAVVGLERVGRQILDEAAAFDAANRRAPAEVVERRRQARGERPRRVAPQVLVVIGAVDVLDEVEALRDRAVLRIERQAAEKARQREADVARILGIAERLPLRVFNGIEHLAEIARLAEIRERFEPEQLGRRRRDERRVRGGRDVRHLLDEVLVFRLARDLVVAHQHAERRAAERAEFLFVHLLEERALIELGRVLEIANEIALRRVQRLDLDRRAGVAFLHQVIEPAPGALETLELRRVHHGRELRRDQAIELRDARVDGRRQVVRHHHRAVKHLTDELADQILRARMLGFGFRDLALLDDLVEQRGFRAGLNAGGLGRSRLLVHFTPPLLIRPACRRRPRSSSALRAAACSTALRSAGLRACRCRPVCCAGPRASSAPRAGGAAARPARRLRPD